VGAQLYRRFILPGIVPVGVTIVTGLIIIAIGEALLALYRGHGVGSELERPELWVATLGSLVILGVCALLASRPPGSLGPLDRELMIGKRPMLAPPLPPVDVQARRGREGTIDDIRRGFALYARNGQLAVVREVLRDVPGEFAQHRRGFIYAQGVRGANDDMWIPIEAVSAVYPETGAAFLAIAGDEIEAFGWDNPPVIFNLRAKDDGPKLY
jgi:hypothetical protein